MIVKHLNKNFKMESMKARILFPCYVLIQTKVLSSKETSKLERKRESERESLLYSDIPCFFLFFLSEKEYLSVTVKQTQTIQRKHLSFSLIYLSIYYYNNNKTNNNTRLRLKTESNESSSSKQD